MISIWSSSTSRIQGGEGSVDIKGKTRKGNLGPYTVKI
jgi:hypothetical protein